MRLSIVAFGQAISFATMFGFYTMCYIMAAIKSPYQQAVRPYMTILTGLISYWNPFVYVFLNGELKNDVRGLFCSNSRVDSVVWSHLRLNRSFF